MNAVLDLLIAVQDVASGAGAGVKGKVSERRRMRSYLDPKNWIRAGPKRASKPHVGAFMFQPTSELFSPAFDPNGIDVVEYVRRVSLVKSARETQHEEWDRILLGKYNTIPTAWIQSSAPKDPLRE